MYNISTSNGPLMITYYSGDEYNCIVNIALGLHNDGSGAGTAQAEADKNERNRSIREAHGITTCSNYVYEKNTFVLGDKWVSYVNCKNGYKYMEVNTDGEAYSDLKWYPTYKSMAGQARIIHYCTH